MSLYRDFIKNVNVKLFPPDFFEPILPRQMINPKKSLIENEKEDKRIFVDLSKEYEEDKELIDLLEGKSKNLIYIYNINYSFN